MIASDVSAVLALALGHPNYVVSGSWQSVLRLAQRERCVALAWKRSGSVIRQNAPSQVVAEWRAAAISALDLAEFWESLLSKALSALRDVGVDAVVLKGLPLSQRLYGDASVRMCADLDLFVPMFQRTRAHEALTAAGWRHLRGEAPQEGLYRMTVSEREASLEVHSSLLDDDLVSHLRFREPASRLVPLGTIDVPAHDDDQLAAYLASHLAKHATPPLLWFVDFATLWQSLTAEERATSRLAARSAHAHRYLDWATHQTRHLIAATSGPAPVPDVGRTELHYAIRIALLAGSPADSVRAVRAWLFPREATSVSAKRAISIGTRIRKLVKRGLFVRADDRHSGPAIRRGKRAGPRAISLDAAQFGEIADQLAAAGADFSIRASGRSMRPSLEPGAIVSLAPLGDRPVRVGDVVLVASPVGSYVLHRVTSLDQGWIQTKGDANPYADDVVPMTAIKAIATGVFVDGVLEPIPRSRGIRALRSARAFFARPRRPSGPDREGAGAHTAQTTDGASA